MPEAAEISVHQLLRKAYRQLGRRHRSRDVFFPSGVCVEIADDSDGHRTRRGYFRYRSAKMFRLGRGWWAIARGERYGQYPADPYDSDIVAVRLPGPMKVGPAAQEYVADRIRRGEYFANSLVVGMFDGRLLQITENMYGSAVALIMAGELKGLTAAPPQRDGRYIDLATGGPVTVSSAKYRREAIGVLVRVIEAVLGA